jgi:cytochrome c
MSDLRFNTIAGTALAAALGMMGLGIAGEALFHPHVSEEPAIEVALEAVGGGQSAGPAAPVGPPDFGTILADEAQLAALIDKGDRLNAVCTSCHTFEKGGANGQGPALWNVFNRPAGTLPGFAYSDAMKAYAQPWSYDNLYAYLEAPQKYVKGTTMTYAGLRKSEDRLALVAYLRAQADAPAPLPAPRPAEPVPVAEGAAAESAAAPGAAPAEPAPAAAPQAAPT